MANVFEENVLNLQRSWTDMRALKTMEEVIAEEQDVLADYLTDAVYEIDGLTIKSQNRKYIATSERMF